MKTSTKPKSADRPPTVKPVECLDGLRDCLETIEALGGLLEAAGQYPHKEPLKPEMVSHTGRLIVAEAAKAYEWVGKLEEASAR